MKLSEHNLIKISLIGFLVCFVAIYVLDVSFEPDKMSISQIIDENIVNKNVVIVGDILSQRFSRDVLFLRISDENLDVIEAVVFDADSKLNSSLRYKFVGKTTVYNSRIEIVVKEVEKFEG